MALPSLPVLCSQHSDESCRVLVARWAASYGTPCPAAGSLWRRTACPPGAASGRSARGLACRSGLVGTTPPTPARHARTAHRIARLEARRSFRARALRSVSSSGTWVPVPKYIYLVGRLAPERRVRYVRVVLLDVEADEAMHLRHGLQRVKEQPAVLERAPPRLDQRTGERQVHLGQDAAQDARLDQAVHVRVAVLDALARPARTPSCRRAGG